MNILWLDSNQNSFLFFALGEARCVELPFKDKRSQSKFANTVQPKVVQIRTTKILGTIVQKF